MRKLKSLLCLFIIFTVLFATACGVVSGTGGDGLPDIVYVRTSAFGNASGSSWNNAMGNLQEAIEFAANPVNGKNYVFVLGGKYLPSDKPNISPGTADNREKHFSLRNNVTVIGGFKGDEVGYEPSLSSSATLLSGNIDDSEEDENGIDSNTINNAYHVFYHPSSMIVKLNETAVLKNVTITGGNANAGSGDHERGGGMYNNSNKPKLIDCTFEGNRAQYGGGVFNYYDSNAIFVNCTFIKNETTTNGGGMANDSSSPTITNCTFIGNTTQAYGGGLINWNICNTIITNCTFSANIVTGYSGGGIQNSNNSVSIRGTIIVGNTAPTNSEINSTYTDGGSNLIGNASNTVTAIFADVESGKAVPKDNGGPTKTVMIKSGGPAHNKILESSWKTWYDVTDLSTITDQRGKPRFVGTGGDIGSVELQAGE